MCVASEFVVGVGFCCLLSPRNVLASFLLILAHKIPVRTGTGIRKFQLPEEGPVKDVFYLLKDKAKYLDFLTFQVPVTGSYVGVVSLATEERYGSQEGHSE